MVKLENQITATDKTKHAFASFRRSMSNSQKAVRGLSASLGAFVGIASLMKLKQLTSDAVRFGSQIAITSSKIGVSAKNLQALRLAGEQFAGIESRTLDMGLQRFARRLGEANKNTGELKGSLDMLGISTRDSQGNTKSSIEVLKEYADAVKNADSQQERLRLSFKAFDSEGAVLVELMKEGGDALQEFIDQAERSGAIMSVALTEKAKELNKQLSLQNMIVKTQLHETFLNFGNILTSVTGLFGKFLTAFNEFTSFSDPATRMFKDLEKENATLEETQLRLLAIETARSKASFNKDEKQVKFFEEQSKGARLYEQTLLDLNNTQNISKSNFEQFSSSFSEGLKNIKNNLPTLAEEGKKFATTFETGLKGAFDSVIDGTKSVGESLKDFGKMLIQQAIKMMIFRTIIAPISGAFGGALDGLLGKASGGSVSKGTPYIVGEKGAEMFVPNQSGTIVPNHKMGGSGVVINQTINLSGDVSAQIRSQVLGMLPSIAEASRGAVLEAQRRGQPA